MAFNGFDDGNKDGVNVNITDPTDESKKASVENGELSVNDTSNTASSAVFSVGTAAVRIDTPVLSNRKQLDITCQKTIYVGFNNTITTTDFAYKLFKGQAVGLDIGPDVELWAISDSTGGTADVAVSQGARS